MILLNIILIIVGLVFITFGYFIYFKEKYKMINDFEADYKAGRKTKAYAKKVGLVEIILGIILIIVGLYFIITK